MSRTLRNTSKTTSNRRPLTHIDQQTDQTEGLHHPIKKIKTSPIIESKINIYEQIKQIPQYKLTLSQMKADPLQLITKLQEKFKGYGAVKIKTCNQWQPPFCFKYSQRPITTRIQKIYKLRQGKPFKERIEEHSIKSFHQMAGNFGKMYQNRFQTYGSSPQSQIQQQYWNLIKAQSSFTLPQRYKISVQYAADLPVHRHGSGFPLFPSSRYKDDNFDYATSLFNLNNIYKSPKSLLNFTQGTTDHISGVNIPWVYMGMQFSSFCWHVQDLGLNSLNYSHVGGVKTWYVIPESFKEKFDEYVMQKVKNRELLSSITLMVDPIQLMQHGIKVYKAYQRPKQYILTLFNAYHCGFSQDFNVGEAANVITIDSLEVIRSGLLKQQAKKAPVICYAWLIANNIGNKSLRKSQIENQYNRLINQQQSKLQKFTKVSSLSSIQIIDYSTKYDRMTCSTCKYYQYFSCLKCNKCSKKYCLSHAHQCCGTSLVFVTRPCDKNRKKILEMAYGSIK